MSRHLIYATIAVGALLVAGVFAWKLHDRKTAQPAPAPSSATVPVERNPDDDKSPTLLYAHNLELRMGPNFRVFIRWIRGRMLPTTRKIPSFDSPDSFVLSLEKGVIDVNIADFSRYMGTVSPAGAPLQNISVAWDKDHLRISGTLHKGVPVPVEVEGTLIPASHGLVLFRVSKISALKLPVKKLLGALNLSISDLMPSAGIAGVHVSGNDIFFDTQVLMPPPHLHGEISSILTDATTIKVIYGGAHDDEGKLARWHNFLQLTGGTLSFGKVTMRQADLTLIDASQDPWFDLDLVNYQEQLTNGYALMTPQEGLEVFMPGLDDQRPGKLKQPVTLELLRDREKPIAQPVPK